MSFAKWCIVVWGISGCASARQEPKLQPVPAAGPVLDYSFGGIDGLIHSTERNRGRVTVLLFVTTFDAASQAQAKRLQDLYRTHTPRINAVAAVLEAPRNVTLARTFREILALSYPVAMAPPTEMENHALLKNVRSIPTWIFLDREGRVIEFVAGSLSPALIEEATRRSEATSNELSELKH